MLIAMNQLTNNDFVYNLVLSLTGVDLHTVASSQAEELVHECLTLFIDFISFYIQENYSLKDAIRIRSAYETGDNILQTFPELVPMYEAAYSAFLAWLEKSIDEYHEQSI